MELPIYKKKLPQIWIEDDKYIIQSPEFRYVIETTNNIKRKSADPLTVLFKLCRKMSAQSIASTY